MNVMLYTKTLAPHWFLVHQGDRATMRGSVLIQNVRRAECDQAASRKRRRWHTPFLDATKHRLIQPRGQIRERSSPDWSEV